MVIICGGVTVEKDVQDICSPRSLFFRVLFCVYLVQAAVLV
jgi:hypothetical protein